MTLIMSEDRPQQIWDEIKTLTCRPRKEGDRFQHATAALPAKVLDAKMRTRWQVNGVEGIVPKRGHPVCLVDGNGKVVTDLRAEYRRWAGHRAIEPQSLKWARDLLLWQDIGYRLLRVKLLEIKPLDVRDMTHAEALAEGFEDVEHFFGTWVGLYDNCAELQSQDLWARGGSGLRSALAERPDNLYQAWMLRFEVVKS